MSFLTEMPHAEVRGGGNTGTFGVIGDTLGASTDLAAFEEWQGELPIHLVDGDPVMPVLFHREYVRKITDFSPDDIQPTNFFGRQFSAVKLPRCVNSQSASLAASDLASVITPAAGVYVQAAGLHRASSAVVANLFFLYSGALLGIPITDWAQGESGTDANGDPYNLLLPLTDITKWQGGEVFFFSELPNFGTFNGSLGTATEYHSIMLSQSLTNFANQIVASVPNFKRVKFCFHFNDTVDTSGDPIWAGVLDVKSQSRSSLTSALSTVSSNIEMVETAQNPTTSDLLAIVTPRIQEFFDL